MTVKELAPAKINLYLDVLGKRDDGLHNIETLMQVVTLSDDVIIEYEAGRGIDVTLRISGNDELSADENNLVIRAFRAFTKMHPLNGAVNITLNKRIPTAAGLGGGSADAAATLRALNKLTDTPLSQEELLKLAETLGADVPFCLIGGRALCYGKGERITPLEESGEMHILIAKTNESVSTPLAYRALDSLYSDFVGERKNDGREEVIESLKKGDYSRLYNIFEEPILDCCPKAKAIKKRMLTLGARSALMSGSGPSVFGIFDSEEMAVYVKEVLERENENLQIFVTKTI